MKKERIVPSELGAASLKELPALENSAVNCVSSVWLKKVAHGVKPIAHRNTQITVPVLLVEKNQLLLIASISSEIA